jgi:hypothetical protein
MLVEKGDLKIRTRKYALAVIHLFSELPKRTETQVLGRRCSDLGRRSEHIIGRPHRQNRMLISSVRSRERCKSWKKVSTGWTTRRNRTFSEQQLFNVKKETGELKGIFVSIVRKTKARIKISKP